MRQNSSTSPLFRKKFSYIGVNKYIFDYTNMFAPYICIVLGVSSNMGSLKHSFYTFSSLFSLSVAVLADEYGENSCFHRSG